MARLPRTVWLLSLFSSSALALMIAGARSVPLTAQSRSITFPVPVLQMGQTSAIMSVDVTPSGRYLATTSGYDVAIWDREKGWLLRTLTGHRSDVEAVAFSPDGTLVASGAADGELSLWRVADGRRLWNKTQTEGHIAAVRFARDGSILTASWDKTNASGRCSDRRPFKVSTAVSSPWKVPGRESAAMAAPPISAPLRHLDRSTSAFCC